MKTFLVGDKIGRLTVMAGPIKGKDNRIRYVCRCDCGTEDVWSKPCDLGTRVYSCGCLRRETCGKTGSSNKTHGDLATPEYRAWHGMRQRCNNPDNKDYHRYGARGIKVDPAFDSFETFLAHIGRRPSPQHSLDRIDNSADYAPGNVRWATRHQQARNRRSTTFMTWNGKTLSTAAWAEETGIPLSCLKQRRKKGWATEEALTLPPNRSRRS